MFCKVTSGNFVLLQTNPRPNEVILFFCENVIVAPHSLYKWQVSMFLVTEAGSFFLSLHFIMLGPVLFYVECRSSLALIYSSYSVCMLHSSLNITHRAAYFVHQGFVYVQKFYAAGTFQVTLFLQDLHLQAWTGASSIPVALVSMLLRLPNIKFVIVTLGERGCIMLERSMTGMVTVISKHFTQADTLDMQSTGKDIYLVMYVLL